MAISKSYVPDVHPGTVRAEHRVEGDSPFRSYPTEEAAQEREAELAVRNNND